MWKIVSDEPPPVPKKEWLELDYKEYKEMKAIELTDTQREIATEIIAKLGVRHVSGKLDPDDGDLLQAIGTLISVHCENPKEREIRALVEPLEATVPAEQKEGVYKGMFYDVVVGGYLQGVLRKRRGALDANRVLYDGEPRIYVMPNTPPGQPVPDSEPIYRDRMFREIEDMIDDIEKLMMELCGNSHGDLASLASLRINRLAIVKNKLVETSTFLKHLNDG